MLAPILILLLVAEATALSITWRGAGDPIMDSGFLPLVDDLLEKGKPLTSLDLKGGVLVPALSLYPEDWMRHTLLGRIYDSIAERRNVLLTINGLGPIIEDVYPPSEPNIKEFVHPSSPLPFFTYTNKSQLKALFFRDVYPDRYICGYTYRVINIERTILNADMSRINNGYVEWREGRNLWDFETKYLNCLHDWGPYVVKVQKLLQPRPSERVVVVGVPFSEQTIHISPGSRRVFSGKWLVNGSEWRGPYLDIDLIAYPGSDLKTWSVPYPELTGESALGCIRWYWTPKDWIYLYNRDGSFFNASTFLRRFGHIIERLPWLRGVTILKIRHNTTAEPLYYNEYILNFTIPEGFTIINGSRGGWFREGSMIRLPFASEVMLHEGGTKLVVEGWRDSKGMVHKPGDKYIVSGPETFSPVLATYHRVSVSAPPEVAGLVEGSGWWREGSVVMLRFRGNVSQIDDRTRYLVHGFESEGGTVKELEVKVDAPIDVKLRYERQYLIRVVSRFLTWNFTNPWFIENKTYMIVLDGEPFDFTNGTRIAISGIYVGGRVVGKAEPIDIKSLNMTVSGRMRLWNVTFEVKGPPDLTVEFDIWYALRLDAPLGALEGIQTPSILYVMNGSSISFNFAEIILLNGGRYVFEGLSIDGSDSPSSFSLIVTAPHNITARYRLQLLVWPKLVSDGGLILEPDQVLLINERGEERLLYSSAQWIDAGSWRVGRIVYRGVEVRALGNPVKIEAPGDLAIRSGLHDLKIMVVDVFGMPVPAAGITLHGPVTESLTASLSGAASVVVPYGKYYTEASSLLGGSKLWIEAPVNGRAVRLIAPLSIYTLALILSGAAPASVMVIKRWRRGGSGH